MAKFFSISLLREDIDHYLKKDTYTNCKSDLCIFFRGKSINDVFNSPILLAPNDKFRYIKSRVENSNLNKGKSGCYRLYYYVDIENEYVYLLGFYPKTGKYGRGDLSKTEEKNMITKFKEEKKAALLEEHDIDDDFKTLKEKENEKQKQRQMEAQLATGK